MLFKGPQHPATHYSLTPTYMQRLGLGSEDIRIRVNNRKVLQAVAQQNNIPDDQFSAVCVVLDKLEKIPEDEVLLHSHC